jgi:GNAT superfamily N-acetyltransferase
LAGEDDIASVSRVVAEAADDLDRKRGFYESPTSPIPPNPIHAFSLKKTPAAFWVAEKDGEVIGFSNSFLRGSLWYLSFLFILPNHQGQSIGKNLLERTLGYWKDFEVTNRATITFAYNPTSQFLYMQYGMYPREPAYYVSVPSKTIKEHIAPTNELDCKELSSLGSGSNLLRRIDEHVLGFWLEWHHEYFFETHAKCYLFERNDRLEGYAYVRPNGNIGPLAVMSGESVGPVAGTALALAANQEVERVGFWTPGSNSQAVQLAIKHRMRIDAPMVFMSTRPFGRWENYLFHSAALM